ncbi:MAG TPA: hypothetical protein VF461_22355 [Gemmatimonadaceae bacterium]
MIASSRARVRAAWCTIVAAMLGVGLACTDFPRVNPFDDEAIATLVVSGPDSVTTIGDTVTFNVKSQQGTSLDQVSYWTLPGFLKATSVRNQFVVVGQQNSARIASSIAVRVNASTATRPLVFAQQARSLSATSCSGGKVLTFTSLLDASAPTVDAPLICAELLDRRGYALPGGLTGVIRDTRVVRFVAPNQLMVNALSVGSTYVVYTGAGFTDSIRADVRQDLALYQPNPPCPPGLVLSPGQTTQITAVPSDAHFNPLVDSVAAQAALAALTWKPSDGLGVTVSSSGLVTASALSEGYVYAFTPFGQTVIACYVIVR